MGVRVLGVAVRIATATPGLEVRPASVISSSDRKRAGPNAILTTTVGRASLALTLVMWRLRAEVRLAFLLLSARRVIRGLAERGGCVPPWDRKEDWWCFGKKKGSQWSGLSSCCCQEVFSDQVAAVQPIRNFCYSFVGCLRSIGSQAQLARDKPSLPSRNTAQKQ
jgi:hypothetical protein